MKKMKTKLNGILTLLLVLVAQLGFAQQKTISGSVTDQDGMPLPGATVMVKGTSNGTTSDFDGNYSIVASTGDTLVISFIGYIAKEVTVGASDNINVSLEQDAQALEEVVVSALGVTRAKKALGYSQQTVQGENLVQTKEVDLNTALSGKVAGVQMIGAPSSTFDQGLLRLRGETGVLYVVDGVKVYSQSDINTDNIGNISVLKGAAATALYGVDARNGVVVITSKTAKDGVGTLLVDHTTSMTSVALLPKYQNEYGGGYYQEWDTFSYNPDTDPAEWAAFEGQKIPYYAADESWGPRLDGTLVRHWDSWIPGSDTFGELRPWSPNPNNIKNFFETGVTSNTSLSFGKGGDDYSFRATARATQATLPVPNAARDTYDVNINGSVDLTDKFTMYSSLNARIQNTDNYVSSGYGSLQSNFSQWWQRQLDMDRLRDNYHYNGAFYTWNRRSARNARPQYWDAPHYEQYQNTNNNENSTYSGNFGFNYDIIDGLSANVEVNR